MTPEQQKRAFTSLLSTTKQKGTGLGLAVVSKIVEAHHGKVRVKSKPGQGTTVTLILPARGSWPKYLTRFDGKTHAPEVVICAGFDY